MVCVCWMKGCLSWSWTYREGAQRHATIVVVVIINTACECSGVTKGTSLYAGLRMVGIEEWAVSGLTSLP